MPDDDLSERIRRLLAGRGEVVERRMMGALVFMLDGHMCCGAGFKGLMLRVGKEGMADALAQPHAGPMQIGARRTAGFVRVAPEGCRSDAALAAWVERGIACVARLRDK